MALRTKALAAFKNLHRARMQVFGQDAEMLASTRENINTEFRKNTTLSEEEKITDLIESANEVATFLRTNVVQAQLNEDTGAYKVKITKDTQLNDNVPYMGGTDYTSRRERRKNKSPCES